jgi:hypothetical protein
MTHITATDMAIIGRARRNVAADKAGHLTVAERAGIFSVNTEELLEVIDRLTRRQDTGTGWPA